MEKDVDELDGAFTTEDLLVSLPTGSIWPATWDAFVGKSSATSFFAGADIDVDDGIVEKDVDGDERCSTFIEGEFSARILSLPT